MTRIILLICCILCGFLIGRYLQKQVQAKNQMYLDLLKYIAALKLNVNGRQVELERFNADFCVNCSGAFCSVLQQIKYPHLKADKRKTVQDFFANLNCASGNQLLQHLEFYEAQLRPDAEQCAQAAAKSSVYVKIGILLGAMVGILFL